MSLVSIHIRRTAYLPVVKNSQVCWQNLISDQRFSSSACSLVKRHSKRNLSHLPGTSQTLLTANNFSSTGNRASKTEKGSTQKVTRARLPLDDHDDFKLIYKYLHIQQDFRLTILTRYQCIFFGGAAPFALYHHYIGALSLLATSTFVGLSTATTVAMLLYWNFKLKNRIARAWVKSDLTQIKLAHLTFIGKRKDVIFTREISEACDNPAVEYVDDYATVTFRDSSIPYAMPLKDGVATNEKLFLETFGATALSVINEK